MSCDKCKHIGESYDGKPFIPAGGSCNDSTYICTCCAQAWWQYNGHFHLWREVPKRTYLAVRLGQDVVIDVGTGEIVGSGSDFF